MSARAASSWYPTTYLLLLSVSVSFQCCAQYSPQVFPAAPNAPIVSPDDLARLTDDRGTGRAASDDRISIARLSHEPSHKARTAFVRGMKFARAGAQQDSVGEFEKAIALDPDFSEAYGNLGVEYTLLGRFDEAVAAFRGALRLDPTTADHPANLAFTLVRLKRYEEAKAEAQTAIGLDPGNSRAQFLLGYLLARYPETRKLSQSHLIVAAKTVPEAHLVLALVYGLQGSTQLASAELDLYRSATRKAPANNSTVFWPAR
jgi:tetratricopeptide (TPR) repeat protein